MNTTCKLYKAGDYQKSIKPPQVSFCTCSRQWSSKSECHAESSNTLTLHVTNKIFIDGFRDHEQDHIKANKSQICLYIVKI